MSAIGGSPQELLLSHLDFIRDRVQQLCRRHRAPADAAEELFGDLKLKLLANDYEVLRRFRGDAQLTTYLSVVIDRFFFDWTSKQWGAWRRGSRGARGSAAAEEVERLIQRDGFSRDEALRIAAEKHGVAPDCRPAELDLPPSSGRARRGLPRPVPLDAAMGVIASDSPSPEERLCARDSRRQLDAVLGRALAALAAQDRLLIQLRYGKGISVAAIARTLGMRQRDLYTRVNRSLAVLRRRLQSEGVTWRVVREHLARVERLGEDEWEAREAASARAAEELAAEDAAQALEASGDRPRPSSRPDLPRSPSRGDLPPRPSSRKDLPRAPGDDRRPDDSPRRRGRPRALW